MGTRRALNTPRTVCCSSNPVLNNAHLVFENTYFIIIIIIIYLLKQNSTNVGNEWQ